MNQIIVAIDGHAGTGKSSTAKSLAKILGYTYVDTGAMYRAVTLYFLLNGIDVQNQDAVNQALKLINIEFLPENDQQRILLNQKDVTNEIRHEKINNFVSEVSSIPAVRKAMVSQQKEIGRNKGVVVDGRDIGTNVFPSAELKIFMEADVLVRAKRRFKEIKTVDPNSEVLLEDVKENLIKRDKIDSMRSSDPLRKAEEAISIDTSYLTFEEQLNIVYQYAIATIEERN